MIWLQYVVFGVGVGAVYALLAAGIVLVYRATGVLNFAHASIGVTGTYLNFELLHRLHWLPVGAALVLAMAAGALIGLAAERFVFRAVAGASQVVKLLVSFGLAGVLQGGTNLIWNSSGPPPTLNKTLFSLDRGVSVAGAHVPYQRLAVILLALAATAGLAVLVRRTAFGTQLRALAQNPLAARLAGVNERRIHRLTWALAGATAVLAAVLVMPFGSMNVLALSGFQLRALAAALVGGFASLPAALVGGLALGVVENVLVGAPAPFNGIPSVLATVLILVLLLVRVERFFVSDEEARAVQGDERMFAGAVRLPLVGQPRVWLIGAALSAALVLPLSGFWAFVTTRTALYAVLGLSVVVLTGFTGQISLMPGTFAGVGACLAWVLGSRLGLDAAVAVPLAALATIPVCAVVGVVAVRLRPLYLAVATLALAQTFDETLFHQGWFANGGTRMTVTRPGWLAGDHVFAAVVLLVAGGLFAFTAGFARSRTGRALRMVRDNPRAAEAAGVNPLKYRLMAFALSAALAGLMGALLAYLLGTFTTDQFSFLVLSLTAFGMATVGGIRSPAGSVVAAFALVELTEVFNVSSDWVTVAVGAGIVIVLGRSPDGLVGLAQRAVARLRPVAVTVPADSDETLTEAVGV